MNKLSFWVYELHGEVIEPDWADKIDPGCMKLVRKCINRVVVDDCSDKLCIYGYGKDGKHYQYDSYEAYHSHDYFQKDFDKHGLIIECYKVEMPMSVVLQHKG